MIIAIAASENNLNAIVDPHFGRCEWYCIYNTETHISFFTENLSRNHQESAVCMAAEFLQGENVNMVIAGRFGSKVTDAFRKSNIQMVIPETQQTLNEFINQIK